jgi:NAD(P)-dependent dehydrogenase (short-subunit alcohol dehydrogenase family)
VGMDGKVALVTGAGRGIGRDYALGFARDGVALVVADLDEANAERVAAEAHDAGVDSIAVAVDVADEASVDAMTEAAMSRFGRVDILVNNAGLWGDLEIYPVCMTPTDYWNKVFAVNVGGAFLCSKALLPQMRERKWGRIVNQSSVGAYMIPGGVYSISKLALNGLTAHLAFETGIDNITVNAIAPGLIDTEATQKQVPDQYRQMVLQQTPTGRPGTGEDLYGMVRYLCSDAASWVTGQTFMVNGGFMSRM